MENTEKYTWLDAIKDELFPSKAKFSIKEDKETGRLVILTKERREELKAAEEAKKEQVRIYNETLSWEYLTGTKKYEIKFFPQVVRNEIGAYIYSHRDEFPPKRLKEIRKELKLVWKDAMKKCDYTESHILSDDGDITMQECAIAMAILEGNMTYAEYKEKTGINPAKDYSSKSGGDAPKWWIVTHMLLNGVDIRKLFAHASIMNRHFFTRHITTDGLMAIYEAHMNGYDDVIEAMTKRLSDDKLGLILMQSSVRDALRDGIDLERIFRRLNRMKDPDFKEVGDLIHYALLAGVKEDDIVNMINSDPKFNYYCTQAMQKKFLELQTNRVR